MERMECGEFIISLLKDAGCKKVNRIGNNIRSTCPLHSGKTATSFSITVNDEGCPFQCFSCHQTGTVLKLIMKIYDCSYYQARKLFRKKVMLTIISIKSLEASLNDFKKNHRHLLEQSIDFPPRFENKPMFEYMHKRNRLQHHGIMDVEEIIKRYSLYYCAAGRFAYRIIMPIRNIAGDKIFFTNRSIVENAPKNLFVKNSDADSVLYGLYESLGKKKCILVEGPFDMFQFISFLEKENIKEYGVVCNMGTVMNETRAVQLSEIFEECHIVFDNDKAGIDGSNKAKEIISEFMPVINKTEFVYSGKDPGKSTKEQLYKIVNSKPKKRLTINF